MLGIKEDTRTILERLRRGELRTICKNNNISYNEQQPATLLRQLIEGAGVDPLSPNNGVEYEEIEIQNDDGSYHKEIYPVQKEHASARKDIDYDKYLSSAEDVDQVQALQDQIKELQKKLESKETEIPYSDIKMPALRKAAKKKGIKFTPSTKKAELIEGLNEDVS